MKTQWRSILLEPYPKDIMQWMGDHPLKACGFTAYFTVLSCLIGQESYPLDAPEPNIRLISPFLIIVVLVSIAACCFIIKRDVNKKTQQTQPHPNQ